MERIVVVRNKLGLHARPAAEFVKTAAKFPFAISVEKNGKIADAKSIFAVLSLSVQSGEEIKLISEGEDALSAFDALEKVSE